MAKIIRNHDNRYIYTKRQKYIKYAAEEKLRYFPAFGNTKSIGKKENGNVHTEQEIPEVTGPQNGELEEYNVGGYTGKD